MDHPTLDISKIPAEQHFAIPFFEFVSKDFDLDAKTMTMISKHCELVTYEKGSRLLDAGSDCRYIHFIISGEGISYFTNHNGKTITWFFHFNKPEGSVKNTFAVDYKSFLSGEPATISIETLSEVTAIRFSREHVRFLSDNSILFERWIRIINERAFIMIYDRVATLLTLSATERYKKFLKDEPYLLNMFNNYYIASYLDVAPQSLSRIRKNI
ncbi:Crp/Fnr family transcriptional regulator [Flavobacterium sp. LC2016-01]|uniref:Crp/Fnr family transcriptional regulator n=1 Tax=Flavobacterium sp. LC2016-01 TaxID=2675876 RepID=UPI0012BA5F4F|nr:Crp/Fnr family transcriptional regulator [Flavobacterium sp. LC2016-01]MTH17718.1 Crp/Fnr family transcriptional regulator [Flavobacterium sp. LC2016-01]